MEFDSKIFPSLIMSSALASSFPVTIILTVGFEKTFTLLMPIPAKKEIATGDNKCLSFSANSPFLVCEP